MSSFGDTQIFWNIQMKILQYLSSPHLQLLGNQCYIEILETILLDNCYNWIVAIVKRMLLFALYSPQKADEWSQCWMKSFLHTIYKQTRARNSRWKRGSGTLLPNFFIASYSTEAFWPIFVTMRKRKMRQLMHIFPVPILTFFNLLLIVLVFM